MTSPPMPTSQQTKEDTDEVHDHLERTFARIAHRVRECPEADSGGLHSMESAPTTSRSRCSSYGWGHGAGICCWLATSRWRFTSSARCCLPLYLKRGQWFLSWTPSGSSLKQLPFVTSSKASNSITPEDCRIASAPLLAPRRRSGRAKSLPNVAYWHI